MEQLRIFFEDVNFPSLYGDIDKVYMTYQNPEKANRFNIMAATMFHIRKYDKETHSSLRP